MNDWRLKFLRIPATLFLVLTLNFFLPRLMPGDPLLLRFGADAGVTDRTMLAGLSRQYGLDQPLQQQYVAYWQALSTGDLGYSFHFRQPVSQLIADRLGWTLLMLTPALLISSLLALFFGSWAGWRAGSPLDIFLTLLALLTAACPPFLLAMLAIRLFGFEWQWFPLGGISSGTAASLSAYFADVAWHLVLPIMVLAISATAGKFLVMRSGVMSSRHDPYVTYAKIKGLSPGRILRIHILRNACLPVIGMIGLQLGYMISGALVIEVVFSLNGMGTLIYDAAVFRDYPVLQGCLLILAVFVVTVNLFIDVLYRLIDPRIGS
ncbi:MAG TPA: ABC transporter permease [Patescibacteria group bacterium]|nr:ABC transporter permease [Patescibacteria group bacterium]